MLLLLLFFSPGDETCICTFTNGTNNYLIKSTYIILVILSLSLSYSITIILHTYINDYYFCYYFFAQGRHITMLFLFRPGTTYIQYTYYTYYSYSITYIYTLLLLLSLSFRPGTTELVLSGRSSRSQCNVTCYTNITVYIYIYNVIQYTIYIYIYIITVAGDRLARNVM